MVNKNKPKFVTIQVVNGWNEGGRVLQTGDRIQVHPRRAKAMEQLNRAIIIDPEAPYTHPAAKPEHQFKEVKFDEPEVIPEKTKVELAKTVFKGEVKEPQPGDVIQGKECSYEIGEKLDGKPCKSASVKLAKIPSLNDLTFTNKAHVKALKRNGIHVIPDLDGWDVDGLTGINGVSRKTSQKLVDAFNQYCNLDHNKDSDMEIKEK